MSTIQTFEQEMEAHGYSEADFTVSRAWIKREGRPLDSPEVFAPPSWIIARFNALVGAARQGEALIRYVEDADLCEEQNKALLVKVEKLEAQNKQLGTQVNNQVQIIRDLREGTELERLGVRAHAVDKVEYSCENCDLVRDADEVDRKKVLDLKKELERTQTALRAALKNTVFWENLARRYEGMVNESLKNNGQSAVAEAKEYRPGAVIHVQSQYDLEE